MKDYNVYLWIAYLATLSVLLINLSHPLIRYYKLLRKKQAKSSSLPKKQC
jgi:heme exporter protein CcmD